MQVASTVPSQPSTIGYVTTGHHSLARGRGFAIGAIPLVRLLELDQQVRRQVFIAPLQYFLTTRLLYRLHPNQNAQVPSAPMLVTVRNTDGNQYLGAVLELLES